MSYIAIVICNYNKSDYVVNCVNSLFDSSFKDFDIYLVDNASTDNSVKIINQTFKNSLNLIVNKQNLGGSGGFNTGIKKALEKNYKYIMLIDNDIILDKYAIEKALKFIENNEDVALVGSKIYSMDNPNILQELGACIDFCNFTIIPNYKGCIDNENIPKLLYCDYVPVCSALVRVEAITKIGLMNESNFIYWDDIEWGYRFKKAGYKVVAFSESKVWHKMGAQTKTNTFATYYFWRNKLKFFAVYCDNLNLHKFCKIFLRDLFKALYSCNYNYKYNTIKSLMMAYDDALNNISGMAGQGRIFEADKVEDKLETLVKSRKSVLIKHNDNLRVLKIITNKIKKYNPFIKIFVYPNLNLQFDYIDNLVILNKSDLNKFSFDLSLTICSHIFDLNLAKLDNIYIDEYLNLITTPDDFRYCNNYSKCLEFFINCNYNTMLNKINELRKVTIV